LVDEGFALAASRAISEGDIVDFIVSQIRQKNPFALFEALVAADGRIDDVDMEQFARGVNGCEFAAIHEGGVEAKDPFAFERSGH